MINDSQFDNDGNDRILRIGEVASLTGICKTGIYLRMNPKSPYYDPRFPKSKKLGQRAVGWPRREILAFIRLLPES